MRTLRKAALLLLTVAIVAGTVWYATSCRPQLGQPTAGSRPPLPPLGNSACGGHCGTERWAIKTLSDPDRDLVDLRPVDATLEQLVALPRPRRPGPRRVAPAEVTVYRVEARLKWLAREEADGDYHLILFSPRDSTITMIAEVPNPRCAGVCASGFGETFARVRQLLMDTLNAPGGEPRPLIRITGVGFFDFLHHQRGLAPNGIELHPVLSVEFRH
jgi:hypothetical protein